MWANSINVGVIGYGLSAKIFHIPLILALPQHYTLHSILQRHPTPSNNCLADHPEITHYEDIDTLLGDPDIELVVVCSTPATHYKYARKALLSHKHVVVEKPFVPTEREARDLADLAREMGLCLSVYQNRRWDLDFLTLQSLLAEKRLGDIVEFETHYDRFQPEVAKKDWKMDVVPGNGILYDLGSHLIDQVYVLFGPPRQVTGFVQVQKWGLKTGDVPPDSCTVILKYGKEGEERLVTVKSSCISARERQLRFLVRGTQGCFEKVG